MPSNTLLDIALSNPNGDFDILGTALGLFPDLVGAAGDPTATLTVFGPTDTAFLNLANAVDPSVGTDEGAATATLLSTSAILSPSADPTAFLKTVLTYHIAAEALSGSDVASANSIDTLAGVNISPDGLSLGDKDPDFSDPNVTNPSGSSDGIFADNGVLHILDNVLLPYDITFATGGDLNVGRGRDAVVGSSMTDVLKLGRASDIGNGLDGNDAIFGGRGSDLMLGGAGNDKLVGGRGKDALEGGADNDKLKGNLGADWLTGGEGNDMLLGGRGGDSFIFSPFREGEGHDVVRDFNPRNDKLVLDLSAGDSTLLASIADEGAPGLQFTDLLTFDKDPAVGGTQAPVSLGTSADGDLLITHLTGTIELNGIPSTVDPADLVPAIHFILPDEMLIV